METKDEGGLSQEDSNKGVKKWSDSDHIYVYHI